MTLLNQLSRLSTRIPCRIRPLNSRSCGKRFEHTQAKSLENIVFLGLKPDFKLYSHGMGAHDKIRR